MMERQHHQVSEKVREALTDAGFVESCDGEETGFELYGSQTSAIVLHVQSDVTDQEVYTQLEHYRQMLLQRFDVELVFPALLVKEK